MKNGPCVEIALMEDPYFREDFLGQYPQALGCLGPFLASLYLWTQYRGSLGKVKK